MRSSARARLRGKLRARDWNVFVRINNLFDRRYVGSVIVDDSNGRYFEPAPGFNVLVVGSSPGSRRGLSR